MTAAVAPLIVASLFAGVLGGLTGFGFNVLSMPFYVLWLPGRSSVAVGASVGIIAYLALLLDGRVRTDPDRPTLVQSVVSAAIGLPVGLALLSVWSRHSLKLAVGIVVIVCGLITWCAGTWRPAERSGVLVTVGFFSGVMSTSTALNGPPLVALLHARGTAAPKLRATVGIFVLTISIASATLLISTGRLETVGGWLIASLGVAAFGGVFIGSRLAPRVAAPHLRALTQLLIIASGATCIATSTI